MGFSLLFIICLMCIVLLFNLRRLRGGYRSSHSDRSCGRVLETVGTQITDIYMLKAVTVEFDGATIITTASVFGIPDSLAEIVTSGIIGFSCANQGFTATARNNHVCHIAFFLVFSSLFRCRC